MKQTKTYHTQYPNRWSDQFIKANQTSAVKFEFPNAKSVKCIEIKRVTARIDQLAAKIINKDEWGQYLTYEITL